MMHMVTEEFTFFTWHYLQVNASRGIFYLDAPSASVCLLIQLEKHATEEGGVSSSVYSRKEPVYSNKHLHFLFLLGAFTLLHALKPADFFGFSVSNIVGVIFFFFFSF